MYKVVCRIDRKLVSFVAKGVARVKYSPHEWVYAPVWLLERGYGLTVFRDMENASLLAKKKASAEIWECEIGVELPLPSMWDIFALAEGRIRNTQCSWPDGTVMTDKVKLTRKV